MRPARPGQEPLGKQAACVAPAINPWSSEMMCFRPLALCKTRDELIACVGDIARRMGFEHWALSMCFASPEAATQHVWSIDGLDGGVRDVALAHFKAQCNPAGMAWMNRGLPCAWLADSLPAYVSGQGRGVGCLGELAQLIGVRAGLCVPVPGVDGAAGTLTLATCSVVGEAALDAALPHALLFSRHLLAASQALIEAERDRMGPRLSPREVECLSWAAMGKTTWEISRVLDISEHTVIYHLRNTVSKLGAVNRQQAVAKSIRLGLVGHDACAAASQRPAPAHLC